LTSFIKSTNDIESINIEDHTFDKVVATYPKHTAKMKTKTRIASAALPQ